MAYQLTQSDWTMLGARIKELHIHLELLSETDKVMRVLEGALISGSVSVDAESDIRRTGRLEFYVNADENLIGENNVLWFNHFLRIKIGVKTPQQSEIRWYPLGKFLFDETTLQFSASGKTASVSLVDLMAKLTGSHGGTISGAFNTVIPADGETTLRGAMVQTVEQLGWVQNHSICKIGSYSETAVPVDELIPYDLEFSTGASVFDVVKEIRDLYPGYETFFDVDGTFICRKIPMRNSDPLVLTAEQIERYALVISESNSVKFSDIHNVTEVWGKYQDTDRFTEQCTYSNNTYDITFENCSALDDGAIFGVKIPFENSGNETYMVIRCMMDDTENVFYNQAIFSLDDEIIPANSMQSDVTFCFQYRNGRVYFLGQMQVHGITMLFCEDPTEAEKVTFSKRYNCYNITYIIDPLSPFGVDKIGIRNQVLSSGEYDNIYSDDLAIQRAELENYRSTALQDTIDLEMILIPWLEVNQKISYRSYQNGIVEQYLIQKIETSLDDGTMRVTMSKFHSYYPFSK